MQLSKNSNVLIISHFSKKAISGGGPPQEIRDFFLPKVKRIFYIAHPFAYASEHRSSLTIYEKGIKKKQIVTPSLNGPEIIFYILDFFITFYFLIIIWRRIDICISLDNLNTVSVFPFRKIGLIKKLIYYTIDYTPLRFKNKMLNSIYHFADRISCYNVDKIWVLSSRMLKARKNNKVDLKKSAKSVLLPMGANLARIKILSVESINRYDLVFVGIILEKQGIQRVLEALPKIISKSPNVRFIIIGQGEYEQKLKILVEKLNIKNHVIFKGFVRDHRQVERILCKSAVGIAPYAPSIDNYTFFTDPGKPKLYLGCGLPVVITDVPAIAQVIQSKNAGVITDYTKEDIAKNLIMLFSNDKMYRELRKNAIELSKSYDTNNLIEKALKKS